MQPKTAIPRFKHLTGICVPIRIVDVGANPIDDAPPYAMFLDDGDAEVVGFEPNPIALARLQRQKGPGETYMPNAIGDGCVHALHVCAAPGMTSLLEPDAAMLARFHGFAEWGRVIETTPVQTSRLDDIDEVRGADLLKIDIQGGELMALQHGERLLDDLVVVQAEVEFLALYKDQPLFSDVERFMRAHGFMFHRFFPAVSRVVAPMLLGNDIYAGLSQLVWADAVFVRDFARLDRLSERQLLASATILHDCYGSLDLVMHLLCAHDSRSGGELAGRYLAGLQPRAEGLAA